MRSTETRPSVSPSESIKEAIASARLEGLELTPEFLADAELAASREIDGGELVDRTLARYRR